MLIEKLVASVGAFDVRLNELKSSSPEINWYPYSSLGNVGNLNELLSQVGHDTFCGNKPTPTVLDIGAADGDMSFLLESLGCSVDILDNPQTNYNYCTGIKKLTSLFGSSVQLVEQDVDFQFTLPRTYDLALALGILYHLRNPMSFLIGLALHCEHLLLSTRIAQQMGGVDVQGKAVAYLLESRESNFDPTNYWIFSEECLLRLLRRCGWIVVSKISVGCQTGSTPIDQNRDERMFVYCRRVSNFVDLRKHHDF